MALFGREGQGQKGGHIVAATGIAVQEQIAVPALFQPLKCLEGVAGAPQGAVFAVPPDLGRRPRLIIRPRQEDIGGVEHDIKGPLLALPYLARLLFLGGLGLPRDLDEILVVPGPPMIEPDLARLQEQAPHERLALVSGESPEVFGAVAFGLLEEVVQTRGRAHLDLTSVEPRGGDGGIPGAGGVDRGDRGGRRICFEVIKGGARRAVGAQQELVTGLAQLRGEPPEHRFNQLDVHVRPDRDDAPLKDCWSREQSPLVSYMVFGLLTAGVW
jgi:hypothetical protein